MSGFHNQTAGEKSNTLPKYHSSEMSQIKVMNLHQTQQCKVRISLHHTNNKGNVIKIRSHFINSSGLYVQGFICLINTAILNKISMYNKLSTLLGCSGSFDTV